MQQLRFLSCLAADYARLRAVAARDLTAPVPSCPGWTVTDLVLHTAEVYLHKTEAMRLGDWPDPWPPDFAGEEPIAVLERAYAALTGEFATRSADSPSRTWHRPDQTVGFWVRRMAQETVIHRVDAELALGEPTAPIPADLALDGIDELLRLFLDYNSHEFAADFATVLRDARDLTVLVRAGDESWLATTGPAGLTVGGAAVGEALLGEIAAGPLALGPDATVTGEPADLLLWLWGRAGDEHVSIEGAPEAIADLRAVIVAGTQ